MNKEELQIHQITWGSPEYRLALRLRDEVLRRPLGMSISDEDLSKEDQDTHVGAFQIGKIVGTLVLTDGGDYLRMRQVAVADQARGEGVGTRMVRFAEELACEKGFRRIELHARQSAVVFYLKNGYRIIGDEFREIGIIHLTMVKSLDCF